MTEDPGWAGDDERPAPAVGERTRAAREAREQRLARAMRQNLRRRKAQLEQRREPVDGAGSAGEGEQG